MSPTTAPPVAGGARASRLTYWPALHGRRRRHALGFREYGKHLAIETDGALRTVMIQTELFAARNCSCKCRGNDFAICHKKLPLPADPPSCADRGRGARDKPTDWDFGQFRR